MNIFNLSLLTFIILMSIISYKLSNQYRSSKQGYLLSNRSVSTFELSSSFAASWIYVFGIIMVGNFMYTLGIAGAFWFTMPQILVLLIVLGISIQLLKIVPSGYTASDFIKEQFKNKGIVYFFQFVLILTIFNAVVGNLTGFGLIAEYVSNNNFSYITIVSVTGLIILAYTLWGGLKSSLRTDALQMVIILMTGILGAIFSIFQAGGIIPLLNAIDHAKPSLWMDSFEKLGLPIFILLLGAGINDNGFYQRVLASGNIQQIKKSFLYASIMFLIAFSCFAIIAGSLYSLGVDVKNPKLASTIGMENALGNVGLFLLSLAALSASASTIDTALNSFGSIMSNDFFPNKDPIKIARISMSILMIMGIIVASLKIDLWLLFMFFGIARLTTIVPVIYASFCKYKLNSTWPLLVSLITSFLIGLLFNLKIITFTALIENIIIVLVPIFGLFFSAIIKK